jgi:hypothetical protein
LIARIVGGRILPEGWRRTILGVLIRRSRLILPKRKPRYGQQADHCEFVGESHHALSKARFLPNEECRQQIENNTLLATRPGHSGPAAATRGGLFQPPEQHRRSFPNRTRDR